MRELHGESFLQMKQSSIAHPEDISQHCMTHVHDFDVADLFRKFLVDFDFHVCIEQTVITLILLIGNFAEMDLLVRGNIRNFGNIDTCLEANRRIAG